jgi:hypothetical protein
VSLYRVLRTAKATLTRTFYLDEVATDASGVVGVSVTREDGTVVQAVNASGPSAAHEYSFTFQGSDSLDRLDLTWTATVGGDAIILDQDVIEVVGGFFLGLGDIREKIDPVFKDTTRYATQDLIDRRVEVEDEFERICGQAFVPRFERETLSGPEYCRPLKLRWPRLRRVLSVKVGGTAFAASTVNAFGADPLGLLRYDGGWRWGVGNIVVEYEHGLDRPPADIVRAFKLRMKSFLLTSRSPLPDRAERIATTEVGLVTLATAGKEQTGIPEVDAALERWRSPRPGFG